MSTNIVASTDAKAQEEYDGWESVPKNFRTRSGWESQFRKVTKGEKPAAIVATTKTMRLECADLEYEVPGQSWNLYHKSQTQPIKKTPLNVSRQSFWKFFGQANDRSKLIRWTKGEWIYESDGTRHWNADADVWGWKTFCKEWFTKSKCKDHEMGRELYGVFGAENSFYLLIDLDLHKKPLLQFLRRLAVLLNAFHGKYGCHFQVSDEDAGGVHIIFFFGKLGALASRRKWIERKLAKLDESIPDVEFFRTEKGERKLNIEIFPCPNNPHRLPLARGRTMLLDRPLELVCRRGRKSQNIVEYVRWLNDRSRQYMPKDDVYRYILDRLDVTCSSSYKQQSTDDDRMSSSQKSKSTSENTPETSKVRSYSMKGKTRGAIIGFWSRGEPGHFQHLNSAMWVTLWALRAQGCDRIQSVEVIKRYVAELPNDRLSSRLPDDIPAIQRDVERASVEIWNSGINGVWKRASERWKEIGFQVNDKSTWIVSGSTPEVIVDCEEIEFSEKERGLIVNELAPLLVGVKQARKPEKLAEVERAVAYFLRFVHCCDREIPVHGLPEILSGFNLNLRKHEKQRQFFKKLCELKWIYQRADYYHPAKHGGKGSKGRARAYGIGKAMVGKFRTFPSSDNKEQKGIYILSSLFWETTGNDLEIPSYDDNMSELLTSETRPFPK